MCTTKMLKRKAEKLNSAFYIDLLCIQHTHTVLQKILLYSLAPNPFCIYKHCFTILCSHISALGIYFIHFIHSIHRILRVEILFDIFLYNFFLYFPFFHHYMFSWCEDEANSAMSEATIERKRWK